MPLPDTIKPWKILMDIYKNFKEMVLMKRTKFVMLAVIVALVLMGAGYAAWTQVFTIESTVNTGELFVQVENTSNEYEVLNSDGDVVASGNLDTTDDYLNLSVATAEGDPSVINGENGTLSELTFELYKMYPGTRVISDITFQNLGTLKAKTVYSTDIDLDASRSVELWKDIVIEVKVDSVVEFTTKGETYTTGEAKLEAKLEAVAAAIADAVGELDVDAAAKTVTIVQELPISSLDVTEGKTVEWTIPLIFEQYNPTAEEE
jgi:hypothetical protein